jgi:hypothetical protein
VQESGKVKKSRRVKLISFCGGALLVTAAASVASTPPAGGKPMQGPFYNSATNSYFQLYRHIKRGANYRWPAANIQAQRHHYKGQPGRLAIVKDPKTLEFIREKFSLTKATWIGVRFYCKFRKLMWVDGVVQSPAASGMWHSQWYRNKNSHCDRGLQNKYMPLYLTGSGEGGVYWQASGPGKAHYFYLVEFQVPNKSEDVSQNLQEMTVPAEASTTQ